MKKILSVIMVLAMMLSLGVTAFAVEPSVGIIGGADGPTSILISPNPGDMLDGPGMVKDDAPDPVALARAQMPYEDINVWLNGQYMTFPDAIPTAKDGRTLVPFRAALESMGAKVDYDNGKIDAAFENGKAIHMELDSKALIITENGASRTVEMDVAPYVDVENSRTLIPVRFVGEALGMNVSWSQPLRVAYLIDWDKTEAAIDAHFTKFNEMMNALVKAQLPEGNQKSDANVVLTAKIAGIEGEPLKLTVNGSEITDGKNSSGSYTLGLELGGLAALLNNMQIDAEATVQMLNGAQIEAISNVENGIYLRSALLAMLGVPENAWLSVDMNALAEGSGLDMAALMEQANSGSFTMGKLLRLLFADGSMSELMGYMAPDQAALMMAAVYDGMMGDECITVTGNTNKTYTLHSDEKTLAKAMTAIDGEAAAEMAEAMKMDFNMKVAMRGEKLNKVTADMNMTTTEEPQVTMTMKAEGDAKKGEATMTLVIPETAEITMTAVSNMAATSEKPQTAPAAGETVVTADQLMEALQQLMPVR
ncbi:MAG: hypothetical protein E7423_02685 [Ruminococcaceae bacterium]|nr:hypothetical protein [Oscillospiraceae bacterium]